MQKNLLTFVSHGETMIQKKGNTMKTTLKKGLIEYVSKCDSVRIEHNDHIIRIDKEKVTVHVDGVQYAQYLMIEHELDKRVLPFMAETKRYVPEYRPHFMTPACRLFNAVFDNWINSIKSWRNILK